MEPLTYFDISLRLVTALMFGGLVGIERVMAHKKAGVRTYALVSMGAALFILISELVSARYLGLSDFDPLRLASQIVVGVGFLGGGLIILNGANLRGLTTAAGLWVAAGIGMACGFGFFGIAFLTSLLTLFIFSILWNFEQIIKKFFSLKNDKGEV